MNYFWAFCVGGGICVVGQLLIDLTGLTPARILTGYVVAGVVLSAIGGDAPPGGVGGRGGTGARAGPAAPPGGLYLTRVWYEDERLNG